MFYAHFVLAKKGPLARIWLAAHWDKKLTKAHVFETNIESSVEGILQPKVKMALRTSGHLLLGIVRIYSRKAKYLLADCNEAFIKIKIAFRPGVVDLPEGNREAAVAAITLPEVFHDFDTALPDITIDMDAQVSLNQSRAEDITLKEDYGNLSLMADDGFDDMGFDEPEAARDATSMEDGFGDASLLLCADPSQERTDDNAPGVSSTSIGGSKPKLSLDTPLKDDGFGGTVGEGLLDGETGGLFEPAGLFDDAPLGPVELDNSTAEPTATENVEQLAEKPVEQQAEDDSDDDMYDMGPASMGAPSPPSSPESPGPPLNTDGNIPEPESRASDLEQHEENPLDPVPRGPDPASDPIQDMPPPPPPEEMPPPPVPHVPALDHTTLINNDAESFALAPLDATIVHGAERTVKAKRKRKLVVDEIKSISGEEMKAQLSDTTDIVATLDLAPPTKRLMHWKETGGVEKLFSLPGHRILSKTLTRAYLRHLTTRSVENEVYGNDDDQDELDTEIEKGRDEDVSGSGKRRRLMETELPHDLSHLDSFHLDSTRSTYPNEPSLPRASFPNEPSMPHSSLDVPNFMPPQHHLFPPMCDQQIMPPPNMQHGHMVLQPDIHQLPHIPQMMDSMGNQGPSLHSITPSIQSDALPGVPDSVHHSVIEPVPQHMHPNAMAPEHIQQQMQPQATLNDQLSQQMLQNQLPPATNDFIPHSENGTLPETEPNPPPAMNGQMSQHDDDATQPLLDQYSQERRDTSNSAPAEMHQTDVAVPPIADKQGEKPALQNGIDQQTNDVQNASNILFDSLIGDMPPQNTSSLNDTVDMQMHQDKENEYMGSDDDDYGAPASVGPIMPEEQMADETYEQFEERILTKRTTHLLHMIHNALDQDRSISFSELVRNNKRKQVAQKFYTFLVLKKQQAVELEQNPSYGDLIITRGPKYNAVYNGN
ncbi:hypothetical protein CDAR_259622 [Caerostris darwini]|uniref:Double-strand-break repair protein rad21 homolog n=1 Tax=Caerostris darwini TaxID=1538125 RepID=A0AAV4VMR7_9ARAC|nr:hypothetical protein CDAR_259622 [Caerostris darwini]